MPALLRVERREVSDRALKDWLDSTVASDMASLARWRVVRLVGLQVLTVGAVRSVRKRADTLEVPAQRVQLSKSLTTNRDCATSGEPIASFGDAEAVEVGNRETAPWTDECWMQRLKFAVGGEKDQ